VEKKTMPLLEVKNLHVEIDAKKDPGTKMA
jgi:hypothetical protein